MTGLNRKDISAITKQLVDNGFIAYTSNKSVTLDWNRIWLYSTLDKLKLPSKRGEAVIAPVASIPHGIVTQAQPKIKQLLQQYKYTDNAPVRELTKGEEDFYKFIEGLTEEEARLLFQGAAPIEMKSQIPFQLYAQANNEWVDPKEERQPHSRDPLPF